jgi:hypothetical protein
MAAIPAQMKITKIPPTALMITVFTSRAARSRAFHNEALSRKLIDGIPQDAARSAMENTDSSQRIWPSCSGPPIEATMSCAPITKPWTLTVTARIAATSDLAASLNQRKVRPSRPLT